MSILNMNSEDFFKYIQSEKPVLIEFSAPWCGYCRRLEPILEEVSEVYGDMIIFGSVNIDEEPELAEKEQINVIPTLIMYQNGRPLDSVVAPETKNQLEEFITSSLPKQEAKASLNEHIYDMIIIGGGPGGYTSALYASRAGLESVVLEKLSAGGQMALTQQVDNYPGFENGISGFELGQKMRKSAERFGVKSQSTEVISVNLLPKIKEVKTDNGVLYGKTVVLATGANPKKLGIDGEDALLGKGISYCATCDGMFYRNKIVVVVGGGNSAVEDALILSRICKKVIIVHRRDTLRATKVYRDLLLETKNVDFCWDSRVEEILSENTVTGVRLHNLKTNEETNISCDGVFISIGRIPTTDYLQGQLNIDESGYIIADESTRTSIDGVFAVGDVRTKPLRQIVTAVSDGAVAVYYAEEYLSK